eukprot:Rhum_TRINITY_DN15263_c1_g4::Rhum_TRINITY_DN15263_c1_g4_i7::g.147121::m.147121
MLGNTGNVGVGGGGCFFFVFFFFFFFCCLLSTSSHLFGDLRCSGLAVRPQVPRLQTPGVNKTTTGILLSLKPDPRRLVHRASARRREGRRWHKRPGLSAILNDLHSPRLFTLALGRLRLVQLAGDLLAVLPHLAQGGRGKLLRSLLLSSFSPRRRSLRLLQRHLLALSNVFPHDLLLERKACRPLREKRVHSPRCCVRLPVASGRIWPDQQVLVVVEPPTPAEQLQHSLWMVPHQSPRRLRPLLHDIPALEAQTPPPRLQARLGVGAGGEHVQQRHAVRTACRTLVCVSDLPRVSNRPESPAKRTVPCTKTMPQPLSSPKECTMLRLRCHARRQLPVHVLPPSPRRLRVLRLRQDCCPLASVVRPDRCPCAGQRHRHLPLRSRVLPLPPLRLGVAGHLVRGFVARVSRVRRHIVQRHVVAAAPLQGVQVVPDLCARHTGLLVGTPLHSLQGRLRVCQQVHRSFRQSRTRGNLS